MSYAYDLFGWYAGEDSGPRTTPIAPANQSLSRTPGDLVSNWDGRGWVERPYAVPPAITPPANPTDWLIDVGPFFDRFGAAKMAILTSDNATVKALVQDLMVRKWIDLKRIDVSLGLDALIALGVPGVTADLKASVLTTPVTQEENWALRKVYFS